MTKNVPFVVTVVVTMLFSLYMLLDPTEWLQKFMDLTAMSMDYELKLLAMGLVGFVTAYYAERHVFPGLARYVGKLKRVLRPSHQKKRKRYKEILEEMRQ